MGISIGTEMSIEATQQELVEEFSIFDDWMGRYEYVIDLGKALDDFPEEWQTEEKRIKGCQSQVWLNMVMQDEKLHIDGSSDAAIVKGLVAIVLKVYSDRTPQEILNAKPDFIKDIGFTDHLSPTRSNGLHAMLRAIYQKAGEFASA
ncbi:MAG: SufE family protein [Arenicella sp.]